MSEWDYSWDYGGEQPYDDWSYYAGGSPTFDERGGVANPDFYSAPIGPGLGWDFSSSPAYQQFTGWGDPTGVGSSGDPNFTGEGSGNWLSSVLGSLGSLGGSLGGAGGLAGLLGPALSAAGGIAGGAIGSNASNEAARLQAAALNRGIDLQTAQWLQQQANQAPWLQAGQQALPQLQQLAGQGPQAPFQAPNTPIWGQHPGYAPPSATPGWTPQDYQGPQAVNAGDYRWTPGQGPQAQDYRYTPGQTPDAAAYRYTPGAVPTLQGAELLANDPGYQFRQDEARKALEASALARGVGLSGGTLSALQRQAQALASQEYGQAWNRASQQAQMREGWAQQASQMGFGQALSAAQLREQVNQIASQQGWSQAQAEAAFREGMAQQASQQGFGQALAGQGQQFTQGLQAQQWNQGQRQQYETDLYNRMLQQAQERYGRDVNENQQTYDRALQGYNSQLQNQNTQWNRLAGLSGVGQTAVSQLGTGGQAATTGIAGLLAQLGAAQGQGALSQGNSWMNALQNVGGAAQGYFGNQAYMQGLQSILGGLNR